MSPLHNVGKLACKGKITPIRVFKIEIRPTVLDLWDSWIYVKTDSIRFFCHKVACILFIVGRGKKNSNLTSPFDQNPVLVKQYFLNLNDKLIMVQNYLNHRPKA